MAIARAQIEQIARPTWFPRIQRSRLIGILLGAALAGGLIVPAKAADPGTFQTAVDRTTAGPESPGPIPLIAAPVSARTHVLFGAWVKPLDNQTPQDALAAMESKIGRTYGIYHYYHGWQNPLLSDQGLWASSHGSKLLITWKAALEWAGGKSNGKGAGYVRWADIASGKQDAIIRARARELKAFKKVVYLTFHHEPENDRDIPGERKAGTPSQFVAAWRHVWTVFHSMRVTNVRWVWIMMGTTFKNGGANKWYPGGKFVDIVGDDAYNWFNTNHRGASWTSFKTAFQPGYSYAVSKGKPLWVTEVGVQEDPARPGRKAAWLRAMEAQIKAWPDVRALIYYMGGENGWWVDSSSSALAAYKAIAHDPLFK